MICFTATTLILWLVCTFIYVVINYQNWGQPLPLPVASTYKKTNYVIQNGTRASNLTEMSVIKDNTSLKRFPAKDTFYLSPIEGSVGLGNFMYMYASIVGIADRMNMKVALRTDHLLGKTFQLEATFLPNVNFKGIKGDKCCLYDERYLKFPRNSNYTIDNLLQSWRYFNNVQSNIRRQLRFKEHIKSVAEKQIREIRDKYESNIPGKITLIGIHVRRGDKDSELARRTGNHLATPEYIHRAMAYFVSRFPNCVFVVCSDTMKWVKEKIKTNLSMELIIKRNSPVVDMAIISLCNHSIITVGTFGWWAGYLTGGTVVYYGDPYDEKDPYWSRVFKKSDYFPPHWIPMV